MSGQEHRIVVGVDGSESSKAALRWAIGQAKRTGASVDAVTAWRYPAGYGWGPVASGLDLEGEARSILTEALGEVSALYPEVPVRPLIAEGHTVEVLVRAAKDADLLVTGSHGHSGLAKALVGSVSLNCVLHARCPVLVLRNGRDADGPA